MIKYLLLLSVFLTPVCLLAEDGSIIHPSKPLPKKNAQGTGGYRQLDDEKAFVEKITEKPIDLWSDVKLPKPSYMTDAEWQKMVEEDEKAKKDRVSVGTYELSKQADQFVGWFGIVRTMKYDPATNSTQLVIEHKYFDGLCDLDMLVVSIYGAGDFTATIPGKLEAKDVPLLSLVRIYGKASADKSGTVSVDAKYVRLWDWGLFTFMDYGKDKSNPEWVKLRKVDADNIYSRKLDEEFYQTRLGERPKPGK